MATTGGTNLRDDIMRLDETGMFIKSLKWSSCALQIDFKFNTSHPSSIFSTRDHCHSWEDLGPHQKRSCKSQSSADDCPG